MGTFSKFEEYKLFIEDTARFSERRQTVTNTYITVNSALIGLIAFLVKDAGLTDWWLVAAIMPLIAAGIMVCSFWYRLLTTYRKLLDFRFEQLEKMEQSEALSGCHGMYNLEAQRFFRHAPPDQKIGFSRIEIRLPILFIVLYALTGIGLAVATWMVSQGLIPAPVIQP
jgi:fatty acid desaturase